MAGCLGAPTEEAGDRHPFAGRTLTVSVVNQSETVHDLTQVTEDAMAFWEEYSDTYTGFEVSFDLIEHASPDIVVEFVDSPEPCQGVQGWSENVLGCAPLIRPGRHVTGSVRAYVVARDRPIGKVRITTKHEFGHLLGLYHTDAPLEIMSNLPEHRIPLYSVRIDIWELTIDAHELVGEANVLQRHGVDRWHEEAYRAASAAFEAARIDYDSASGLLGNALDAADAFEGHPQVETVDLSSLRSHLNRLRERTGLSATVVAYLQEAADAAVDGDEALMADRLDSAIDAHDRLIDIRSPALRDVAVSLGLVRGFDRDEAVVPADEELDADDLEG